MTRKIVVFSKEIGSEEIKQSLLPFSGGVVKNLPLVNAAVIMGDLPLSGEGSVLARQDIIADVIEDVKVYAVDAFAIAARPQVLPWGVDRIDAEKAWPLTTGANIKVGVIDTGIETNHPDLKVYGGINTINPKKSYKDDNGHGTHVAGTIAALNNKVGVIGVAYRAQLYAVKVLGANGSGYLSDVIEGLDWCIKQKMQVVNMSLGLNANVSLFHQAIKEVFKAGIFITAAAGNSGPESNTVIYPARYPETAAVSAMNQDDKIAYFSSRGPEVDLIAPGVTIYSTYRNRTYRNLSGTSMAAPHVAGTAALVLAQKGNMSPGTLLNHLKETAQDIDALPEEQGAGLVDAYTAVTG